MLSAAERTCPWYVRGGLECLLQSPRRKPALAVGQAALPAWEAGIGLHREEGKQQAFPDSWKSAVKESAGLAPLDAS